MQTYNDSMAALEKFGVFALTGEACGLSMRTLCDLSWPGVDLIADFFGLPPGSKLQPNWNSGCVASRDTPNDHSQCHHHVASIMLTPSVTRELLVYALLRDDGAAAVMTLRTGEGFPGEIVVMTERDLAIQRSLGEAVSSVADADYADLVLFQGRGRMYRRSSQPGTGFRNEHVASGRTD